MTGAGNSTSVPVAYNELARMQQVAYCCPARLAPANPHVDVSVVIVSWNTKELLRACLESIGRNVCNVRIEVIVVDNCSHDGSAEMVTMEFANVRLLVNDRNMGFAAANNRGLCHAQGRYLLLLNSDTVVQPHALEDMVRHMNAHPRVGALGPRLLNPDRSVQLSAHDFPRLDHDAAVMLEVKHWPLIGRLAQSYARHAFEPQHYQTREVDWVMGACLMLRREAVEDVGVLDDHYFFFFEEPDLCYRLRQHGWMTVFLSSAEIVHCGGQSRGRVPATSLLWYYRGLLRYYRLHTTPARYAAARALVVVGAVAHLFPRLVWDRQAANGHSFLAAYARILGHAMKG